MNITEFGQKIKQKYPAYNHLSDEEVGTKMLQKYPQYKSQVVTQPEDKITGLPKTLLNLSQGFGGALQTLGLGAIPDLAARGIGLGGNVAPMMEKATGINPVMSYKDLQYENQHPLQTIGGDVAGAASWMIPGAMETKMASALPSAIPGILRAGASYAGGGAIRGGLLGLSQHGATPETVMQNVKAGAIAEPVLAGAQNVLTELIPKYLGWRAYGQAGTNLPDVIKAERQYGTDLKAVRNKIIYSSKKGALTDRNTLMQPIRDLATQGEWTGTPGLQEIQKVRLPGKLGYRKVETGAISDIQNALNNSTDRLDFYNRVKNMAYPKGNATSDYRLAGFMKSAAHTIREGLINDSNNPALTRKAMDTYAAQTAIKVAKGVRDPNKLVNIIKKSVPEGEAGLGALAMLGSIPALHAVSIPLMLDALVANPVVGPKIATGLVRAGQSPALTTAFRQLGIRGAQSLLQ